MREIFFFKFESGRSPIEDFLDSLSSKQAQKVAWVLQLIEELPKVPSQFFQKMDGTDDLWEIRISFSSDIFRLYGFYHGPAHFVVVEAIRKKTQKTPRRTIATAHKRKSQYLKRQANE